MRVTIMQTNGKTHPCGREDAKNVFVFFVSEQRQSEVTAVW